MVQQRTTGSEVRGGHTLVANHQVCQTLKEDKSTVSTVKDHGVCVCACMCFCDTGVCQWHADEG